MNPMADIDSPGLDVECEELLPQEGPGDGPLQEETPACQLCRKKKSKCSREQPCSQCVKSGTDCVYEDKRSKGGIKTGVIERLNHRIDAIENMFLGQNILLQQLLHPAQPMSAKSSEATATPEKLSTHVEQMKKSLQAAASSSKETTAEPNSAANCHSRKRKQTDADFVSEKHARQAIITSANESNLISPLLPIESVLETYFKLIHPWMPVIHPATFLRRAREPEKPSGVMLIIKAIVAVASPYTKEASEIDFTHLYQHTSTLRRQVITTAIESTSKETLQALLLVTFDSIKRGLRQSPWALVSILCRKIEELQLNLEEKKEKDSLATFFSRPFEPLSGSNAWVEVEERRRVFWATFLLDRFSSIATGSHPIISSKNVQRRLPCDGYRWELDQCVETSFFKIPDQTQDADAEQNINQDDVFPMAYSDSEANDDIGGLAYTIEATESLFLVSKFHDRHTLEISSSSQLSNWLHKFRQLDSRLLQWELCLTQRWREVRVVNGYVDPNLALAHLTHNAAIISLHRRLAYPPAYTRPWLSSLVSAASREACVMAAMKIDGIANRFLTASTGIPPHQFALCLYIAGQVLLAQTGKSSDRSQDTVNSLIGALQEISERLLNGQKAEADDECQDPAQKFAKALLSQREKHHFLDGSTAEIQRIRKPEPEYSNEEPFSGIVDFTGMFQDFGASCSRGRGILGMGIFDEESPNELDQTFLSLGQVELPGSKAAGYRETTGSGGQIGQEPESTFSAELRKLESRARHSERRLRSHVG